MLPATIEKFRRNGGEFDRNRLPRADAHVQSKPGLALSRALSMNRSAVCADEPTAQLLENIIYPEEVNHCKAGVRWFR